MTIPLVEIRKYYTNPRKELAPLLPPHFVTVLDVGCGEGFLLETLPSSCEVWGIEPQPVVATEARRRLKHVWEGTYEQVSTELPADYFDLVFGNDVIEHMTDHEFFFRDVQRILKPGGCLIGSVPNIRWFEVLYDLISGREWRYQELGILDRTHQRHFTCLSLRRTLKECGYEVDRLYGINPLLMSKFAWYDRWNVFFRMCSTFVRTGLNLDIFYRQIAFRARPCTKGEKKIL